MDVYWLLQCLPDTVHRLSIRLGLEPPISERFFTALNGLKRFILLLLMNFICAALTVFFNNDIITRLSFKIPFAFLNIQSDLLNIQSGLALHLLLAGGALGGLISSIINRNENKRIKMSEAAQAEASAKREDAMAATEMMGLLERTVAHMEKMNSYNKSNSEELLKLLKEKEGINEKLKKDIALLQLQIRMILTDHRPRENGRTGDLAQGWG